jgi:hypothetical protein
MSKSEDTTPASVPGLMTFCGSARNLRRALRTALIVGPILTLINQTSILGDLLALRPVPGPVLARIALTFLVPFLVSLFSSAAADRARHSAS